MTFNASLNIVCSQTSKSNLGATFFLVRPAAGRGDAALKELLGAFTAAEAGVGRGRGFALGIPRPASWESFEVPVGVVLAPGAGAGDNVDEGSTFCSFARRFKRI